MTDPLYIEKIEEFRIECYEDGIKIPIFFPTHDENMDELISIMHKHHYKMYWYRLKKMLRNYQNPEDVAQMSDEILLNFLTDFDCIECDWEKFPDDEFYEIEKIYYTCLDAYLGDFVGERNHDGRPGYVYLLKSSNGHYKIGRTIDPESRVKTFGVELPFDVKYIHVISTNNCILLEKELHREHDDFRIRGEWFLLRDEHIEKIKSNYVYRYENIGGIMPKRWRIKNDNNT